MWCRVSKIILTGRVVKAELQCDQEPSTLVVANVWIKRCQSTNLVVISTPKSSRGNLERGERANLTIQGQFRAFREAVSLKYETEIGFEHVLMGWMVRHSAWVAKRFSSERTWKDTMSKSSRQGLHWWSCAIRRGVLWAKPFRAWSQKRMWGECEEFLSASLTAPMNSCCWRQMQQWRHVLWDVLKVIMFGICNSWACALAVRGTQQQRACRRDQRSNKRMSWQVSDVRERLYLRHQVQDKDGRTTCCPGLLELDST